jgi:two-component system sensor histidine kinase CreC
MIDKLLALAAVEHKQQLEVRERIDLLALVEDAATQCAKGGIGIRVDGATSVVSGDPFLLRQAIVNLIENAVSFSPAGGTVEVEVGTDAGSCFVRVLDNGPGVPDYALPRVFERFYSLPRPQGGSRSSGLGLCFVAEVAELHGGRASLENRDNGGAVATLALPPMGI